ncbi:hypothetical protein RJ639_002628 [Escallonia herrerae]|uniref:Pentatricopeptide repeat-containing protein n=1 Tax=Escallonia herrerae TaxID=1293975 RepID=A0AA88XIJ8_9ASTE|nr:hypothetical protein RJ639_002628 [Escallonia herrerae]
MADLMKFHAHFITTGHSNDTLFLSTILSFTALSPNGNLAYARLVFNHINTPNTFMFNTMIRGYSCSYPLQALSLHHQMLQTGLLLNNYTYPFVIKALSKFVDHRYGETVHASIVKSGYVLDLHISNSLLRMYASFGLSKDVVKLFDEMPEPDVVSWNVVINDLAEYGCLDDALVAFREMCHCGIEPDSVTLLGLLSGCTKNGDLCTGKLIHLCIVQRDVHVTGNLGNGLLDMYAKFGDMDSAKKLFDRMETKLNDLGRKLQPLFNLITLASLELLKFL